MSSIKVAIKPTSGGEKFQADIQSSATVRELKEEVARKCDTSADQQRLIYKGQVLKDDRTVDSYGIQHEHVLHMVKAKPQGASTSSGASTSNTETSNPRSGAAASAPPGGDLGLGGLGMGGMGNPEQMQQAMSQMMNNPMMQSVLNDPEMLRNMFSSNPAIQQLMDRNPEFAQVLNNPQQLQEAMQAATNPALMREQMRNQDRTMANIESHPEGFNALRRMYENFQEPLMDAATGQGANQQDPLAALLGSAAAANQSAGGAAYTAGSTDSTPAASSAPNTAPLPNPWAPSTGGNVQGAAPAGLGGLAGLGGMGGMEGLAGLGGLGGAGGGAPDMGSMLQMLQQPGVQQAMQSLMSQPQVMQNLMNSNPQMRAMMDQNPQVREVLNNPDAMRQMLNPENMSAMMQMQQAMQRLQGTGLVPPAAGTGAAGGMDMSALAAMFGGAGGGGGFGAALGGGAPPVADPETAYASQLTQLQDMGFSDRPANIRALQAVSGNVNAAVERLLSGV